MNTDVKEEKVEMALPLEPSVHYGVLDTRTTYIPVIEHSRGLRVNFSRIAFIFLFVIPVCLGVIYNFIIASDRFASTASYIVRENRSSNGLLSLVSTNTISRSDDNSYAVVDFIQSRDAVAELNRDGNLTRIFGANTVDLFSRFPSMLSGDTKEDLYRHFQKYIKVDFSSSSGVSTISVQAFTPKDANDLTEKLLESAESLVNVLNVRAQQDAMNFANVAVNDAVVRLKAIQDELTAFRSKTQILDPESEEKISNKIIMGTMEEMAKTETDLALGLATAPASPSVRQLEKKRDALRSKLEEQRTALVSGDDSLAKKIEVYQSIDLRRQLAEKALASAFASQRSAKEDSQNRRIYLARIVEPNLPDRFDYPKRFLNVCIVAAIGFALFWITRSFSKLLLEEI